MARLSVEVEVDFEDVLDRAGPNAVRRAFVERIGQAHADVELLKEVRRELLNHRPNAAVALIEGALTSCEVTDLARLQQYHLAGRA